MVPILDARNDPRVPSNELAAREKIGSMLFVPLRVRERSLGVLCLCTHHPYAFSEDELFLMRSIGDQCALAIQAAQMYASIKNRYESLTVDFQTWFQHYHTFPTQQGE
jgi:GAF domain-containing protein